MSGHWWWRPAEFRGQRTARSRTPRHEAYWNRVLMPLVENVLSLSGEAVRVPAPIDGAIAFSGGRDSHPFLFRRDFYGEPDLDDELGRIRERCQSIGEAHDRAVMAVLTLLKHADKRLYIRSDAPPEAWEDSVLLASTVIGEKLDSPFKIQSRESPEYVFHAPGRYDRIREGARV